MFHLEKGEYPDPPEGVDEEPFRVGLLMNKLHQWCLYLSRRYLRELSLEEFSKSNWPDPHNYFDIVDSLDAADSLLDAEEKRSVLFEMIGGKPEDCEEILGMSYDAHRKRLQRIRERNGPEHLN